MKIYVKAAFLFLFFFAAVNASFAQTKKPTTPPKQPNTSTETIATEDSTNFVSDTTQNNVAKNEYMNNMTNQRNTDELTEIVKGKRRKNEFSSGGGGGQFNNPHPEEVKPKRKTATEPAPGTTGTGDRL